MNGWKGWRWFRELLGFVFFKGGGILKRWYLLLYSSYLESFSPFIIWKRKIFHCIYNLSCCTLLISPGISLFVLPAVHSSASLLIYHLLFGLIPFLHILNSPPIHSRKFIFFKSQHFFWIADRRLIMHRCSIDFSHIVYADAPVLNSYVAFRRLHLFSKPVFFLPPSSGVDL